MTGPVAIFGAGAAGLGAALAAARGGREVLLLEEGPRPGGTVVHALIHTLGGFYNQAGETLNPGLGEELLARLGRADPCSGRRRMGRLWVFSVDPEAYSDAINAWIAQEPRIRFYSGVVLKSHILFENGVKELQVRTAGRTVSIRPSAAVDATGRAGLIRALAPHLVRDDAAPAASGVIIRVRGIPPGGFEFPRGPAILQAIRSAVAGGLLPPACGRVWIDRGVRPDELYFKWTLPSVPIPARVRIDDPAGLEMLTLQETLMDFLRQSESGFGKARVVGCGRVGIRDGGSVEGEYRLSEADVLGARIFADAACRCAWPIEFWDPEAGIRLRHLPPGASYQIPLRSLKVRELGNLWVAGRCFSGDPSARASARVAGCCFAMGEAVGRAVARSESAQGSRLSFPMGGAGPGTWAPGAGTFLPPPRLVGSPEGPG